MFDIPISDPLRFAQRLWYLLPMGVVGLASWSVWAVRWVISRRYRPLANGHRTSTSVVVPVFREDPDVLLRCLGSWVAEDPGEILLVVDIGDRGVLQRLAGRTDGRVRVIPFRHQGKRSALAAGIRAARNEVVVLTDSDTAWEPGLLAAVQMPFVDPREAIAAASPGDAIELADGTYADAGTLAVGRGGVEGSPVTIRARTRGGVTFTGAAGFVVKRTAHVVLEGFVFETVAGPAVKTESSQHVRVTRNVFRLRETAPGAWVRVTASRGDREPMSHHNRIDHNRFEGKSQPGNFVTIDGSPATPSRRGPCSI